MGGGGEVLVAHSSFLSCFCDPYCYSSQMVFSALQAAFHFPDGAGPLPLGRHFQILNTLDADGGFLVHALLSHAVQAGQPVVLFSCTHPWSHYANIGRKLGVPLAAAKEKGDVTLVDAEQASPKELTEPFLVDRLFQEVSQHVLKYSSSPRPVCLILDNVDNLLDLGATPDVFTQFIDACIDLTNQVGGGRKRD